MIRLRLLTLCGALLVAGPMLLGQVVEGNVLNPASSLVAHHKNNLHDRSHTGKHLRELQQTRTEYQANYVGRFTRVLGTLCVFSEPAVLRIACGTTGRGSIEVTETSNNAIVCSSANADTSVVECVNNCSDKTTCGYYITSGIGGDPTYAEIYFQCQGESIIDAQARFTYEAGSAADCSQAGFKDDTAYVQLGVFCPDVGEDGDFVFNSQFNECGPDNDTWLYEGRYECYEGLHCSFESCPDKITFDPLVIQTDVSKFQNRCVRTLNEPGPPSPEPPTPSPTDGPVGKYTTRYEAHWAFVKDVYCPVSSNIILNVRLSCLGGEIQLIDTLFPGVDCTLINAAAMECSETCGTLTCPGITVSSQSNTFSGAIYVRTPIFPSS